ncbi:MAG: hypothetical protein H7Z73_08450 [Candidatus Saccharibacteria bacterium]|nr:hypothetical protein [Moraxellaceae bacterium]
MKLYPNEKFVIWNKHIDTFNNLERNNFPKEDVVEMHSFLKENFFDDEHKDLITLDLLLQRDFNILLIILHLDALIFREKFKSISLYKYLTVGKIKGKRKSLGHLFWNVVKTIAFVESNKQINKSLGVPEKIPKDEDCFSLLSDEQAERIKYAARQVKEGGRIFYLSYIYQLIGSKRLYESSKVFNSFSLTGLWMIYMHSILFIAKYHSFQSDIYFVKSDLLFRLFDSKYKSEGTDSWPSDLSRY